MAYWEQALDVRLLWKGESFPFNPNQTPDGAAVKAEALAKWREAEAVLRTLGFELESTTGAGQELRTETPEEGAIREKAAADEWSAWETREAEYHRRGTIAGLSKAIYAMGENLDTQFADGEVTFRYDGGFGKPWVGEPVLNPTYMDVWVEAEKAVVASEDHHHCFIESARLTSGPDGRRYAELAFGS